MAESRKYIKTKFEGVFYRVSSKLDPRTGAKDRVFCFWYADAEGKGHWRTVGRQSKGITPVFARNERAAFLTELEAGRNPVENSKVTVGMAVDAYVSWARHEGKHIDRPLQQYDMHMRKRVHMLPIAAITPGMLSRIKSELEHTPATLKRPKNETVKGAPGRCLSAQSIAHLFGFLRAAAYRAMATNMWQGQNPFASRRSGPWQMPKVDNARLRFFTPDEAKKLLEALAAKSRTLRDMAFLSLKTGLRATEIFKLRGQDVDISAGILHVTAKGGRREQVHAPEDIIELLQGYDRSGGAFIFATRDDETKPIERISAAFARTVRELKLADAGTDTKFAVTFHTFRHTFASWLAQSGKVSLLELQKLMRHESISMTQRYAHLIPGQERKKLSIIDSMLNAEKKGP